MNFWHSITPHLHPTSFLKTVAIIWLILIILKKHFSNIEDSVLYTSLFIGSSPSHFELQIRDNVNEMLSNDF